MLINFRYGIYQEISLSSVAVAPPPPKLASLPHHCDRTGKARPEGREIRYLRTDAAWLAKNLGNMRNCKN
eukprot:2322817-Pleurochrysis_carterae.AAC.1